MIRSLHMIHIHVQIKVVKFEGRDVGAGRFHTAVSTGKVLYTFGEDHGQLGELVSRSTVLVRVTYHISLEQSVSKGNFPSIPHIQLKPCI